MSVIPRTRERESLARYRLRTGRLERPIRIERPVPASPPDAAAFYISGGMIRCVLVEDGVDVALAPFAS